MTIIEVKACCAGRGLTLAFEAVEQSVSGNSTQIVRILTPYSRRHRRATHDHRRLRIPLNLALDMLVRLGMIPSATALSERDPRRGGSRRIVRSHGVEDVVRVGVAIGDSGGHTSCEIVLCVCEK
jgi:hypothetical protein